MKYTYKTIGTCSKSIDFEVIDGIITNVSFTGGCNGNLKGICSLVRNMRIDDAITKLEGIKCNDKTTSCPDQLAKALKTAKEGV